MNFGLSIAPWSFGILVDYSSINAANGTGVASSIVAATVNYPLMWHPLMSKPKLPLVQCKLPDE